jgi:multidrug efflux pump subunit AcrB
VQNLQIDLRLNTPEVRVNINRDKLGDIGVHVETVGRTLETMLGGRQVTRFKRDGEQYDVIVQVGAGRSHDASDISDIYVRARDGSMDAARESRRRARKGVGAAVAQPLQPPARGEDHGHAGARASPSTMPR